MKIFNLENTQKGKPLNKQECVVIGTWEEWAEVMTAIGDRVKTNPRLKKLKKIQDDFESLAIY